jgi:RimJ/RimL family protein N-acetyltransferase
MDSLDQPVLDALPYRLRPFVPSDITLIQEASSDPLIPLVTTVPASGSTTAALAFIERQHQRLADRSGYSFAIADATSDQALGQIGLGLKNFNAGRVSIGYWIAPRHRQKGVASRALSALSSWALTQPGIYRLELYIEPWNEGSWRTAERCGFIREGLLRSWQAVGGRRKDMYMYSRTRPPSDSGSVH